MSLTRRELARTGTTWTVASQLMPAAPTSKVMAAPVLPDPNLDPVRWTIDSYQLAPLQLSFRATNKTQALAWQKQLRAKLIELLGGFPARVELKPQLLEVRQFSNYTREKFVFQSRPGVSVLAYLLKPRIDRRLAVAVCLPGHGRGVDDIVGIDENGNDRAERTPYQYDFAIQAVEHGFAALALEPMGFGHRRDLRTSEKGGATASACQPVAGSALLLGQTMIGWRVWDVMRALDWIETRSDLDPSRIGCIGISGGGSCAQFAAALDTRIKAALVSGYLNTYRDSIMSVSHCMDNYVPGILNWAENYDVAGLIAPRYFFSEGGDEDHIFPVHATRAAFQKVEEIYQVFGVPDRARQQIFPGGHVFHGKQGLPFLAACLA